MFEQLLTVLKPRTAEDNSDLPFPSGTPYKGIVRSANSITGDALAAQIGLTAGAPMNNNSGWLHFIEDNGYELLVAKKPLRSNVSWNAIKTATSSGAKTIQLFGEEWVVTVMTGYKTNPTDVDNASIGGQWNRYIGGVYTGPMRSNSNWPVDIPEWGPYTADMLGVSAIVGDGSATNILPGSIDYTSEYITGSVNQSMRGFTYAVGFPRMLGAHYGIPDQSDSSSGWRPILVKKSSIPPVIIPYKGTVTSAELITGTALANALNFSEGSVLYDTPDWLHIEEDGKTYYIAMKSIRNFIQYGMLQAADLLTGNRTIGINGKTYKVRVMTGLDTNTSEWNRWMYNVYGGASPVAGGLPPVNLRWALFTDDELDLATGSNTTPGSFSFIQESNGNTRGYPWINSPPFAGSGSHLAYGWRPVLELVE